MNILHLISGGEVGGSKNHLISILKNMDNFKAKNIVVCFIEGKLYNECIAEGIDIRLIKQNKRFDLSVVDDIRSLCEYEDIDIINCHGGRANFVGYFLRKKYRARYVTTIHSDYKGDYSGNFYKTLVYSNINKYVLKSFDYYITVSRNFKDMLISRGFDGNKIFVVYNGIDFNFEKSNRTMDEIVNIYGLKKANHYVSMIARFHPIKGHNVFVDGCRMVLKSFNDVRFILVGDGDALNEVKDYTIRLGIEKYFDFVGFQKPDDFLKLSDFTVLTSFSESFPLVLLESAAYGKTVIATEVGGIPDLIEDGVNGYLIKPGDSEKLGERMLELLENPDRSRKFGESLYEKAVKSFSIQKLVESYIEIYEIIQFGGKPMIKERYLGVDVCRADMDEVLNEIDNIIQKRKPSFIVAINPEKIIKAQDDSKLREMLNSATLQIPDGVGVLIASKLKGGEIKKRVTGIDLMTNICFLSAKKGYRVFIVGAKPGVAEKASQILMDRYKGLQIVGVRDGYFKDNDELIEDIKSKKADVLFLALGSPKQEYWIVNNKDRVNVPVCMGIGGSLDVICGNIKRAPAFMCDLGLEWLYRLIKEPWRIKRMSALPKFLVKVVGDRKK